MSKPRSLVQLFLMSIYCLGRCSGRVVKTSFLETSPSGSAFAYVYTEQEGCYFEFSQEKPLVIEFVGFEIDTDLEVEVENLVYLDTRSSPEVQIHGDLLSVTASYDDSESDGDQFYNFDVTLKPQPENHAPIYSFQVNSGKLWVDKMDFKIGDIKMESKVHFKTFWGDSIQRFLYFPNTEKTTLPAGMGGPLYKVVDMDQTEEIVMKLRHGKFYEDTMRENIFLDEFKGEDNVIQKARGSIYNKYTKTIALFLDYYPDGDLRQYYKKYLDSNNTEQLEKTLLGHMYAILKALRKVSEKGMIHQDICLENVFIDEKKSKVVVGDFQFAMRKTEKDKDKCGHTENALPGYFVKDKYCSVYDDITGQIVKQKYSVYDSTEKDFHALYVMIFYLLIYFRHHNFNSWINVDRHKRPTNYKVFPQHFYQHIKKYKEEYSGILGKDIYDAMSTYFSWRSEENEIYLKIEELEEQENTKTREESIKYCLKQLTKIKEHCASDIKKIGKAFDKRFDNFDATSIDSFESDSNRGDLNRVNQLRKWHSRTQSVELTDQAF